MARLMDFREGMITVERHQFYVTGIHPDEPLPEEIITTRRAYVGPGLPDQFGWTVHSPGEDHIASVRAELWDGPPDDQSDDWEDVIDFSGTREDDRLQICHLTRSPEDMEMPLPGGRYNLRLLCKGRGAIEAAIDAMFDDADDSEEPENFGFPTGVEQYLLQLWPTG
jgi:hypothetical protein